MVVVLAQVSRDFVYGTSASPSLEQVREGDRIIMWFTTTTGKTAIVTRSTSRAGSGKGGKVILTF